MAWIWATLMPHPPVILPEVGGGREREASTTLSGMEQLVPLLEKAAAGITLDYVLLLSPHQEYAPGALQMNSAAKIHGNLARFGAPDAGICVQGAPKAQEALAAHLSRSGIPVVASNREDISKDHGSLVPLVYLSRHFSRMPAIITASPTGLSPAKAWELGRALARFNDEGNWALLASGDLSHRLTPNAPAGYSQTGKIFDLAIVRALQSGDISGLAKLSEQDIAGVGECGLRSVLAMLGLCGGPAHVLSYEGPFGVGYCTAFCDLRKGAQHLTASAATSAAGGTTFSVRPREATQEGIKPSSATPCDSSGYGDSSCDTGTGQCPLPPDIVVDPQHPYPRLARRTVSKHLAVDSEKITNADVQGISPDAALWTQQKACFVSIKTKAGALRGCIGTILPVRQNLCMEIIGNAVSAATQDPRFPPMTLDEVADAVFSVDVLSAPEIISSTQDLDPAIWGVIITQGQRRGLLLPALEGVDTVEKQLAIAAQKGGITNLDGAILQRFSVSRYKEK